MRWAWLALPALVGCGTLVRLAPEVDPCTEEEPCGARCAVDQDCDDGVSCTKDRCVDQACTHETDDAACDDGSACTGTERCDDVEGCVSEGAPCDDGVECTEDSCIEDDDGPTCARTPRHEWCPEGQLCRDGCREVGCDEGCADADVCNGEEVCREGACLPGDPIPCDDGLRCTGDEVCDPRTGACLVQPPPACPDLPPCGLGRCDIDTDGCVVDPLHELCEDGDGCTVDVCGADGTCQQRPVLCDDGNDCTTDSCSGGACVGVTRDADDDGHPDGQCVQGGDCDDADGTIHPGADEVCNKVDDDCDGAPDDGFACVAGTTEVCFREDVDCVGYRSCDEVTCAWGDCAALPEDCQNGDDEDCDEAIDEEDPDCNCLDGVEDCLTPCGTGGQRTCADGTWGACVAQEICNGIDDDCDDVVDGGPCEIGDVQDCGGGCGSQFCGPPAGNVGCDWSQCFLPPEQCNGQDDDCDGVADEDFQCIDGAVSPCTTACGGGGWETCTGCFLGPCVPEEDCDGVDDDCDGACDDGWQCCQGVGTGCATDCNTVGSANCDESCEIDECVSGGELCNGLDDDCDGNCDAGLGSCCAFVESQTCSLGGGVHGREVCTALCEWSKCCTDSEVCGGDRDDDCDGVDEQDEGCCAGLGVELCNGLDDDCNGLCDDEADGECCLGAREACVVPGCNVIGRRNCELGCTWGDCTPLPEIGPGECKNHIDDDCDGQIDAADPGCLAVVEL